jgi:hypothetical protein
VWLLMHGGYSSQKLLGPSMHGDLFLKGQHQVNIQHSGCLCVTSAIGWGGLELVSRWSRIYLMDAVANVRVGL